MALLRRGSSRISEENFNSRLVREKAKTGAVTASLAWNDPSDLDLHATVFLKAGGVVDINYRNKVGAGGNLDVDMNAREGEEADEPVENIFWKKPPAGIYSISVDLYKKRGTRGAAIPFRALLKREEEDDLSREGEVEQAEGKKTVEVFRFTVDEDGDTTMGKLNSPLPPRPVSVPMFGASRPMRAMRVMKAMKRRRGSMKKVMKKAMKKPMKVMKKVMKVSKVASGKKAKAQVWKGSKGKVRTGGKLKKDDLMKNKEGKIVSKKQSKSGRESKWAKATAKARATKGYTGFKAIKKGGSFYEKAKEYMAEM